MSRYYELSKTFANPEYKVMLDAELDMLRHNAILKTVDRYRRVTELALLAQLREAPEN